MNKIRSRHGLRFILLLLAALLLALCSCGKKGGAGITVKGEYDQIKWSLDGTTLTFTGEGELKHMDQHYAYPYIMSVHSYVKQGDKNPEDKGIQLQLRRSEKDYVNITVTKIVIGEGITAVDSGAFSHWPALEEVQFPSTLTRIGDSSFSGCPNLRKIELQEGLDSIESYAFSGCSLKNVNIPESVTFIARTAFIDNK